MFDKERMREILIAAIQYGFDCSSEGNNGEYSNSRTADKVGQENINAFLKEEGIEL